MQVAPVKVETLLIVGLVGLVAYGVLRAARAAPEALATVGRALDPTSDRNVAYRGASAVVSAAAGREETLGGWFYDLTHPDPMQVRTPGIVAEQPSWNVRRPIDFGIGDDW